MVFVLLFFKVLRDVGDDNGLWLGSADYYGIQLVYNATTHVITTIGTFTENGKYKIPYYSTNLGKILGTKNTTAYTPTDDYNPATKKYVDDSIASAIGSALGGSY